LFIGGWELGVRVGGGYRSHLTAAIWYCYDLITKLSVSIGGSP
jgi:hypothetical protein